MLIYKKKNFGRRSVYNLKKCFHKGFQINSCNIKAADNVLHSKASAFESKYIERCKSD